MSGPRANGETYRTKWFRLANLPAWAGSGMEAYRIWIMWNGFSWMQRHEWLREDGQIEIEEWINSLQIPPDDRYDRVNQ